MKTQEELRKDLDCAYKAAAEQAGIESWNKLAEYLGIPYPTIYRIINGKGTITESMVRRICTELALKGIKIENSPIAFANTGITNNGSGNQKILDGSASEIVKTLTAEMAAQREQYASQMERLLTMLEREQSTREELIKRLQ